MHGMKEIWVILVVAILFIFSSKPCKSLRILSIFPLSLKSHFNVFENLGKSLAAKGHQIDVYSHFPLKETIPNYKDYSLKGSSPSFQNNLTFDEALSFGSINFVNTIDFISNITCQMLDHPKFQNLFKNQHQEPPYDLVIVEIFFSNCFFAWGRFLNIPMVAIMTSNMLEWYNLSFDNDNDIIPYSTTNSLSFNLINFQQRLNYFLFNIMNEILYKYYINKQTEYIKQYFGPDFPNSIELQKDIDLLLINSHYSLNGIRPNTPEIVPIAGLHIKDDNTKLSKEVQKWLDDSKNGCIYFSFGSMVRIETFPKPFLNEIYTSLKKIAPVRVLMKIAQPNELPPGLPSNVMTQSWFSQEQVLKHKNIKAFITHGGLLGTLESIYYGVPMICIPIFGDQHMNTEINVNKGIAIAIDFKNTTEYEFGSALKEIIYNPIYKENSIKLSKVFVDRPMKPLETAIYWIEYIGRHGKKSLKSPLVDIPWWQANHLEIKIFILILIIFIFYVLKFLLKKIYYFCFSNRKNNSYSVLSKSKKNQ